MRGARTHRPRTPGTTHTTKGCECIERQLRVDPGNLTDPELRVNQNSGKAMATFTVAINGRKNADGTEPEATFVSVTVLGDESARNFTASARKGDAGHRHRRDRELQEELPSRRRPGGGDGEEALLPHHHGVGKPASPRGGDRRPSPRSPATRPPRATSPPGPRLRRPRASGLRRPGPQGYAQPQVPQGYVARRPPRATSPRRLPRATPSRRLPSSSPPLRPGVERLLILSRSPGSPPHLPGEQRTPSCPRDAGFPTVAD